MASVPGEHAGILWEENIALRQLLGYNLETLPASPYRLALRRAVPAGHLYERHSLRLRQCRYRGRL